MLGWGAWGCDLRQMQGGVPLSFACSFLALCQCPPGERGQLLPRPPTQMPVCCSSGLADPWRSPQPSHVDPSNPPLQPGPAAPAPFVAGLHRSPCPCLADCSAQQRTTGQWVSETERGRQGSFLEEEGL